MYIASQLLPFVLKSVGLPSYPVMMVIQYISSHINLNSNTKDTFARIKEKLNDLQNKKFKQDIIDEIDNKLDHKSINYENQLICIEEKINNHNNTIDKETNIKVFKGSWLYNHKFVPAGLSKLFHEKFGKGESKHLMTFVRHAPWIVPVALIVMGIGTMIYKDVLLEKREEKEYQQLLLEEKKIKDDKELKRQATLSYKIEEKLKKIKESIKKNKGIYTLVTLPVAIAAIFSVIRSKSLHKLSYLLINPIKSQSDKVFNVISSDLKTYKDTNYCLRTVDPYLHKKFKNTTKLSKLYYAIIHAQYKRRNKYGARSVLNTHLIRVDGKLRDSVAEVAMAVKMLWEKKNIIGIMNTRVKHLFTRKRTSSAPIIDNAEDDSSIISNQSESSRHSYHHEKKMIKHKTRKS